MSTVLSRLSYRRGVVAAVVCFSLVLLAVDAVQAHLKMNRAETWRGRTGTGLLFCMLNEAQTDHTSLYDKGYSASIARTRTPSYPSGCTSPSPIAEKAPGNLKAKFQYWKKQDGGGWALCYGGGWEANNHRTMDFTNDRGWTNNQPCGKGTYRTYSWTQVKADGEWHGDGIVIISPDHNSEATG